MKLTRQAQARLTSFIVKTEFNFDNVVRSPKVFLHYFYLKLKDEWTSIVPNLNTLNCYAWGAVKLQALRKFNPKMKIIPELKSALRQTGMNSVANHL